MVVNMKHKEVRMFTREEFGRLVAECRDPETRDLMLVLRESGCRVREVLNLRKRCLELDGECAVIRVDGKTGPRAIPLRETVPILLSRSEGVDEDGRLFPRCYLAYYKRMRALLDHLGIVRGERCRVVFHGIRHLAYTQSLADGMPRDLANKKFGWSEGSRMPETYNHLQCRDLIEYEKKRCGLGTAQNCGSLSAWAFGNN